MRDAGEEDPVCLHGKHVPQRHSRTMFAAWPVSGVDVEVKSAGVAAEDGAPRRRKPLMP